MSIKQICAHSKGSCPLKNWQPLEEHLKNVSESACFFAMAFGFED